MSTYTPPANQSGGTTDADPVTSPDHYQYSSEPGRDIWTHQETGLQVEVHKTAKPTQMHTPETAGRDVGYRGRISDGNHGEPLANVELGDYNPTLEDAEAFMQTFPSGEYECAHPSEYADHGEARWKDVASEEGN